VYDLADQRGGVNIEGGQERDNNSPSQKSALFDGHGV